MLLLEVLDAFIPILEDLNLKFIASVSSTDYSD